MTHDFGVCFEHVRAGPSKKVEVPFEQTDQDFLLEFHHKYVKLGVMKFLRANLDLLKFFYGSDSFPARLYPRVQIYKLNPIFVCLWHDDNNYILYSNPYIVYITLYNGLMISLSHTNITIWK